MMLETDVSVLADAELVQRAQEGEQRAFGELYRRYLSPIYRYDYYRVGNREDAEDITELVFLRAWQALPRYRETEAGFQAWLYRIARNAVIDYYRSHRNHVPLERAPVSAITLEPDAEGLGREEVEDLRQALVELPDEQRDVVILRFIEGFSHGEVAEALNKSEGACRMIQLRALKALSSILGGKGE